MAGTSHLLRVLLFGTSIYAVERQAIRRDPVMVSMAVACIEAEIGLTLQAKEAEPSSEAGYDVMCSSLVALASLVDSAFASAWGERLLELVLASVRCRSQHGAASLPKHAGEEGRRAVFFGWYGTSARAKGDRCMVDTHAGGSCGPRFHSGGVRPPI